MTKLHHMAGTDALAAGVAEDRQFYQDNFLRPSLDLRAIGLGMGAGNEFAAANDARATSNRMSGVAERAYERDTARSGIAGDAAQQASRRRRLSLSRVISEADAGTRAARGARATQREAQAFGTQFYGDLIGDSNSALRSIADAEQNRESQYRSARSSASSGALGLVGMAASFI